MLSFSFKIFTKRDYSNSPCTDILNDSPILLSLYSYLSLSYSSKIKIKILHENHILSNNACLHVWSWCVDPIWILLSTAISVDLNYHIWIRNWCTYFFFFFLTSFIYNRVIIWVNYPNWIWFQSFLIFELGFLFSIFIIFVIYNSIYFILKFF